MRTFEPPVRDAGRAKTPPDRECRCLRAGSHIPDRVNPSISYPGADLSWPNGAGIYDVRPLNDMLVVQAAGRGSCKRPGLAQGPAPLSHAEKPSAQ